MLVSVKTSCGVVFLEVVSFKVDQKRRFNWNLILTDDEPLIFADWLITFEPRMSLDLLRSESLIRVSLHNPVEKILAITRDAFRHLELSTENFLIELVCIFVFEGQVAGDHCK